MVDVDGEDLEGLGRKGAHCRREGGYGWVLDCAEVEEGV